MAGKGRYRFQLGKLVRIVPWPDLIVIKIPDATPEIIAAYALTHEQSLLAKVRYNRLIDIFLGIGTASSLSFRFKPRAVTTNSAQPRLART